MDKADKGMYARGYRYRLEITDTENKGLVLYTKSLMEIGPWLREYPTAHFDINTMTS